MQAATGNPGGSSPKTGDSGGGGPQPAVLVEAAVRNYILQLRGIDSTREFIERQQKFMEMGE